LFFIDVEIPVTPSSYDVHENEAIADNLSEEDTIKGYIFSLYILP